MCFKCCRIILEVFHADVAKVDLDVVMLHKDVATILLDVASSMRDVNIPCNIKQCCGFFPRHQQMDNNFFNIFLMLQMVIIYVTDVYFSLLPMLVFDVVMYQRSI